MKLGIISSHARVKMRQQGISEAALQGLLDGGRTEPDSLGGKIIYFDHEICGQSRVKITSGDCFAILDRDGEIITVGSRFSRVRRH